ncbi:MAG: acetylglutamate kinase [Selenomonadaceae bacterium]|nr:acetylglutamate kinase [Selenomonadaceae bacterium]
MFSAQDTASVLVAALPYIKEFAGKTVVIKYGGNAMISDELKKMVMEDIALMKYVGISPVIVHGGGPDITGMLKKVGKQSEFVAGLRVTDQETVEIAEMVLSGKINSSIVSDLNLQGTPAIGLNGKDAFLLKAKKKLAEVHENGKVEKVDIGFVGEVETVNEKILQDMINAGYVPVIAPIGMGSKGESYNINADTAAAKVAGALKAEKLLLLTDVEGIYKDFSDKSTFISSLTQKEAEEYIDTGVIDGGMIPKVEACFTALSMGAGKTSIIDGRKPHSLLLELFTPEGIGTEIVK